MWKSVFTGYYRLFTFTPLNQCRKGYAKKKRYPMEGGHGGGDPVLPEDVFIGTAKDKFNRAALLRDGGNAVLIGVGANQSMKSGLPVQIQELVKW